MWKRERLLYPAIARQSSAWKIKTSALWELYTRHQFETDIQHYLIDVEKVLLDTVAASGLEPGSIDAVVKTGGSSSIPLFTEMLTRIFGAEKVKESNAFSSVVAGLAIKASMAVGQEPVLSGVSRPTDKITAE